MRRAGLFGILMLAACTTHSGIRPLRPLEIATAPYQEDAPAALAGSLMYEGGCLLFHDDESKAISLPVWPVGTTFNGTSVRFHKPGKADQLLTINEEFVMAGRPREWGVLGAATYRPLQHQCGAYQPFFVALIRPAN